jgi:hypothetical protein
MTEFGNGGDLSKRLYKYNSGTIERLPSIPIDGYNVGILWVIS